MGVRSCPLTDPLVVAVDLAARRLEGAVRGTSILIGDEMMAVFDAPDVGRQELIPTCSQFLVHEQYEEERTESPHEWCCHPAKQTGAISSRNCPRMGLDIDRTRSDGGTSDRVRSSPQGRWGAAKRLSTILPRPSAAKVWVW
jgi:hypothetical protein